MFTEYLQIISHIEGSNSDEAWFYLFRVMEVLNRVRNEVRFRDLVVLEDVIIPFHDKLSRQLVLAFAGIGTAAGSEKEDVSST